MPFVKGSRSKQAEQEETQDIMFGLLTDPARTYESSRLEIRHSDHAGDSRAFWPAEAVPVAIKLLYGIDLHALLLCRLSNWVNMLASFRHPNTVLFIGMVIRAIIAHLLPNSWRADQFANCESDDGTPRTGKNTPEDRLVPRCCKSMVYLHCLARACDSPRLEVRKLPH